MLKEGSLEEVVKAKAEIMVEVVTLDQEILTHHPQDQDKEINHHMEMIALHQVDLDPVQEEEEDNHHLDKEVVKVEGHLTI